MTSSGKRFSKKESLYNFFSRKSGFTLVELLMVIAIMAILMTIAVSGMITAQRNYIYLNEYKQLAATLRVAKVSTLTATNTDALDKSASSYTACFNKNSLKIFINFNLDYKFNDYNSASPPDFVLTEHSLPQDFSLEFFEGAREITFGSDKNQQPSDTCLIYGVYSVSADDFTWYSASTPDKAEMAPLLIKLLYKQTPTLDSTILLIPPVGNLDLFNSFQEAKKSLTSGQE